MASRPGVICGGGEIGESRLSVYDFGFGRIDVIIISRGHDLSQCHYLKRRQVKPDGYLFTFITMGVMEGEVMRSRATAGIAGRVTEVAMARVTPMRRPSMA